MYRKSSFLGAALDINRVIKAESEKCGEMWQTIAVVWDLQIGLLLIAWCIETLAD